jgi:hypothetical protein
MKNQKSLIIVGLLVVGAVAVLIFDQGGNAPVHPKIGQPLVLLETLPQVKEFAVIKGDRRLSLAKNETGMWSVDDGALKLPADGKKVANALDQVGKLKIQRLVSKTPDSEQGIETGTKLVLGSDEATAVVLGDRRTGGGQYIQLAGGQEVFLTNEAADISVDLEQWELKTLLDVKREEIKSAEFSSAKKGQALTLLSREKAEDKLAVQALGKAEKTRESALGAIEKALEALSFSRRVDPSNEEAKTALANGQRTRFTLFDGRTYEITVGKVGKDGAEKYFVAIRGERNNATLDAQKSADLDQLNDLMSKWSYEFSSYNAKRLIKERADLVEAEKS